MAQARQTRYLKKLYYDTINDKIANFHDITKYRKAAWHIFYIPHYIVFLLKARSLNTENTAISNAKTNQADRLNTPAFSPHILFVRSRRNL